MFVLGGLFVAVIVGLIAVVDSPGLAMVIGVVGLGIAWWQWYKSDTVALKAMRARVVTPHEAPELHAMIDRLCALADMPKPTVAIAYTDMPNAFATGRSPSHSAVCVTTGHPRPAHASTSSRACWRTSCPTSPTATCS